MGDITNMNDIDRFMRTEEGKAHLDEIRGMLEGHTINKVSFSNEMQFIATELLLDDGETFVVFQPSLDVDVLREAFGEVLDREYYKDYPDRRPK